MDDSAPTVETPASPTAPQAGMEVGGRWRLESPIAHGGMGEVWRATDVRLDEVVCVKLLRSHLPLTDLLRERFRREAHAAARLRGPNIVSIFDYGIDDALKSPYIAMEYLRGESLFDRLTRGALGYLQTGSLLQDVCDAVGRAHDLGIIHRDLKPGNIFLTARETGFVTTVLDFGIVKAFTADMQTLTGEHAVVGTPNYMSPEQFEDSAGVDHRADLWAVAIIAYECMTGCAAFVGDSPLELALKIRSRPATLPSMLAKVPEGFDAWFRRGTDPDIRRRFQSTKELIEAFRQIGSTAEVPRPRRRSPSASATAPSWASDANQIDIDRLEEVTFESALVHEFLSDPNRYFVSGAKGCGKTLLLTHKRARLQERYKSEGHAAVTFIPEGRPYLDLMSDVGTMSKASIDLMSKVPNTKRLWAFALKLAALSHSSERIDAESLVSWPVRLREVAEGRPTEPTVIIRELLMLTPAQLHATLGQAEMPLEHAVRAIHSGMYFFVDKIDQALRGVSRDAWIAMQAGLVEAAWDIVNTNAHLKVYATIRAEAFSSYESDIKSNLYGAITNIRYSKEDLRAILEHLTAFYEGLPLRDFVSVEAVHAPGASQTESAFDFMHRHSLGRPRDLVIVASEISRNREALDERRFKRVVHETSAGIIVSNVFDEMRVFLEVLADRDSRRGFFARLPFNVLTEDDLIGAWCAYHGVGREYYDDYGRTSDDVFHPFRELYDCGLLGCVERDAADGERRMAFKQPHEPMDERRRDIPRSSHYLLHPTFAALVRRLGLGDEFRTMREIVVGHEAPWLPHYTVVHAVQRQMYTAPRRPDQAIEDTVLELLADFGQQIAANKPMVEARAAIGASAAFVRLCHDLERLRLDEVHLALLEAFGGRIRKKT